MITLQELIYDISQIWREDNKASFEQKYFETKTSIELYTEQLHKPVVGGPASASGSEGEQLATEAVDTGVWDGERCPRCKGSDLLDTDDHWTHCQNCGFSFVGG